MAAGKKKVSITAGKKKASILEDEFMRTIIKGALKSLKYVSIMAMDLKLAAIIAMLESYVEEQEKILKEKDKPEAPPFGYSRSPDDLPRTDPRMPIGYAR